MDGFGDAMGGFEIKEMNKQDPEVERVKKLNARKKSVFKRRPASISSSVYFKTLIDSSEKKHRSKFAKKND